MPSRYINKKVYKTTPRNLGDILKRRNLNNARILETIFLRPLTQEAMSGLEIRSIVWKKQFKLFKLAQRLYGDPKLWWIIAWFNQKPTDADYKPGDIIKVPFPPEEIIRRLF